MRANRGVPVAAPYPGFPTARTESSYSAPAVEGPGGRAGVVVPGLIRDVEDRVPERLRPHWGPGFHSWHTAGWWARHWARTGLVDVVEAEALEGGHRIFRDFQRAVEAEDALIEADEEGLITFLRIVVEKKAPGPRGDG